MPPQPKIKSRPFEGPFVRVRGRLSRQGEVRWSPCLRTFHRPRWLESDGDTVRPSKGRRALSERAVGDGARTNEPPPPRQSERSRFFILFLDGTGEVLERAPVRIRFFAPERQNALFTQRLPYRAETRSVQLVMEDELLGTLDVTEHEPEFALAHPLTGSEIDADGILHLRWEAPKATSGKNTITYYVRYSSDGKRWHRPGVNLGDSAFDLDLRLMPGGKRCVAQVIGTNGYRTAYVETPPFAVPRKAPEVIMSSPCGPLLFAQGYSHEEGPLVGRSVEWLADGQVFGTGASFDARELRRRIRNLSVRVTDSVGAVTLQHLGWYNGVTGLQVPRRPGY